MKNKFVGTSVLDTVNTWKKDPEFKKAVDDYIEKAMLAKMLKEVRTNEHITQAQLAQQAKVPQSVIARIETPTSKTLPRLDLFNRILNAVGYETTLEARKKNRRIKVAFTAV